MVSVVFIWRFFPLLSLRIVLEGIYLDHAVLWLRIGYALSLFFFKRTMVGVGYGIG